MQLKIVLILRCRKSQKIGRDYYYVGKDHIGDFAAAPIRMTLNWIVFITLVIAHLTKPRTDDFERHNTVTGCTLARLTPLSVNTGSDSDQVFQVKHL